MSQPETNLGIGEELTAQAREAFESDFKDGLVRIVIDKGRKYLEVMTFQDDRGCFFGRVDLSDGFVISDFPGQRVKTSFLVWAREKMGCESNL